MNIILFILSLSLLIFIHEFGHFLFAKLFNVYCLEFSIGMGPAIVSKKFKKDPETTYSLRCLPIGGYVSMAGENSDSDEEHDLEIPYQRTINGINPWKRAIVTVAGVTFNFIFAIILICIYTFARGVTTGDNQITIEDNSIAYNSTLRSGDKITNFENIRLTVNGELVYSECADKNKCEIAFFDSISTYLVNNNDLDKELNKYLESIEDNETSTPPVIRESVTVYFTHGEEEHSTVLIREYNYSSKSFEKFGISEATRIPNFFEGIGLTFKTFGQIIVLMFKAIGSLFTPEGFNSLGGVVSMYKASAEMAHNGFLSYLWYLAIISVNLGFFNLLPIPALDGARFYISIIEGISKRKLNPKVEGYLNLCGIILLFSLMIVVTIKDIVQLF